MSQDPARDLLSSLPLDLLQDDLLPLLSASSLAALSQTSSGYNQLINKEGGDGEIVWKRKVTSEFNFPAAATARRSGFQHVYKQLNRSSAYIWGYAPTQSARITATDD